MVGAAVGAAGRRRRLADDRAHRRERPRDRRLHLRPSRRLLLGRLGRRSPAPTRRCSAARSTTTGVDDFAAQIRPLTETLKFAGAADRGRPRCRSGVPRRHCSTSVAAARCCSAGAAAGWVAFTLRPADRAPPAARRSWPACWPAALWAGIAGLLKARTGAHEVIVTIMLNYVGYYLVFFAARTPGTAPGARLEQPEVGADRQGVGDPAASSSVTVQPAPRASSSRWSPSAVVWWLLNRSALGFRFRAVGENPNAARAAGINVGRTYIDRDADRRRARRPGRRQPGARHRHQRRHRRPRRRHRLRRHHRRPARALPAAGHPRPPACCSVPSRRAASRCRPPRASRSTSCWSSSP